MLENVKLTESRGGQSLVARGRIRKKQSRGKCLEVAFERGNLW